MPSRFGNRVTAIISRLTLIVAAVVALTIPIGYWVLEYEDLAFRTDEQALVKAGAITSLITGNPRLWIYQIQRMEELLAHYPAPNAGDNASVYDSQDRLILHVGEVPSRPALERSYPLYDSGRSVGRVKVMHSLRPLLYATGLAVLFGLLLGATLYGLFRIWPLRVLRQMNAVLNEEQAALRKSEERYRSIAQASLDGFWVLDTAGRILEVNDSYLRRSGYSRDELLAMTLFDIDANNTREDIQAILAKSGSWIGEVLHRAKGGKTWPLEVSSVCLPSDSTRRYAFLRDIGERKRIEEERRRSAQTLEAVMSRLTVVEEQERRSIATDLHDDLSQLLAAANLKLRSLPKLIGSPEYAATLREVAELVHQAEQSSRSLSFQISPPQLVTLGLVPALEALALELHKVHKLTVTVTSDGNSVDIPAATRSVLYRATRELLINVAKHAKVGAADVDVRADNGLLIIAVTDSGVGFDKRLMEQYVHGAGFGLVSMRERLRLVGGQFDVDTAPGDGTVATLAVPLA